MPKLLTALVAVAWFAGQSTSLAPFVATPPDVVDRMLTLARTGRSDVVYDIGCGDGRIVIAAAQKYGMFLCVQDLSCPGYSFLHSASIAARIPTIAAIEGNSRQYCPSGNKTWGEIYPPMFHISDGTVGTAVLKGPGLGF